jgi:DNA (cytosine-5)-methyltransferase 1
VLDAQFFGVAQRRRRVFVVGYLGDWRAAAAVLFERHSLQGHPAPSREKRQAVAASAGASASVGSLCARTGQSISVQDAAQGHLMPIKHWPADISSTLDTTFGTKQGLENQHINAGCPMFVPAQAIGFESSRRDGVRLYDGISNTLQAFAGTGGGNSPMALQPIALAENTIGRQPQNGGNGDGFTDGGPMYTLNATGVHGVAQPTIIHGTQDPCVSDIAFDQGRNNGGENVLVQAIGTDLYNCSITGDVSMTLKRGDGNPAINQPTVMQSMAVRRLTPIECERLQGFPDSYTDIKSKNKPTPDGPRYKALGNSMAVPVMAWIGQRIEQVEAICKQNK